MQWLLQEYLYYICAIIGYIHIYIISNKESRGTTSSNIMHASTGLGIVHKMHRIKYYLYDEYPDVIPAAHNMHVSLYLNVICAML